MMGFYDFGRVVEVRGFVDVDGAREVESEFPCFIEYQSRLYDFHISMLNLYCFQLSSAGD